MVGLSAYNLTSILLAAAAGLSWLENANFLQRMILADEVSQTGLDLVIRIARSNVTKS